MGKLLFFISPSMLLLLLISLLPSPAAAQDIRPGSGDIEPGSSVMILKVKKIVRPSAAVASTSGSSVRKTNPNVKNLPIKNKKSLKKSSGKKNTETSEDGEMLEETISVKTLQLPKPEYPAAARYINVSGDVEVEITIDVEGNVISALAVSGHPLLRPSAVGAAKQAKFEPVTIKGEKVQVTGTIVYHFTR